MVDILIPNTDDSPSRLDRGRHTSKPDFGPDPDDLSTVDGKVTSFWAAYPDGRIETEVILNQSGDVAVAAARVWRDRKDQAPTTTATASRSYVDDADPFSYRAVEAAETVAIGRALRFLGIQREGDD
jgi:hypothetical protein